MTNTLSSHTKTSTIFGLSCTLIPVLLYNLYFYNSFYPWTEGWFSTYAYEMNHGKELYKDIYYFMPALYPKIIACFTSIFGYEIVYLRILGVLIILGFSTCLFFIFSQFTSALASSIVAVIVTIYYQHGNAHIPYDFIQVMNLAFLVSYLAAVWSFKLDETANLRLKLFAIFISGFFLSSAALIKQSNGGVVGILTFLTVSIFIIITIKNRKFYYLGSYVIGCSLPFLYLMVDLLLHQSAIHFVQQAFSGALAAKGGNNQIFFSWLTPIFTSDFAQRFKDIFNALLLTGFILFLIFPELDKSKHPLATLWNNVKVREVATFMLAFVLIATFVFSLYRTEELPRLFLKMYVKAYHHLNTAGILSPFVFCFFSYRFLTGTQRTMGVFLGLFCLFMIMGNGTSAGISEAGTFLGIGVGL